MRRVHIVLLSVQFCYAGWHVLGKSALSAGADPLLLALYRGMLSGFLLLFCERTMQSYRLVPKSQITIKMKHLPYFAWLGLLSFGNTVGSVVALRFTTPVNFAILQPSIPVFAMVISFCLGIEPASIQKGLGVLCSVGGAVCVQYGALAAAGNRATARDLPGAVLLGNALTVLQCLAMAGLTVAQRAALRLYPATVVAGWHCGLGSCLTLVICIASGMESYVFKAKDSWAWVSLGYAVIVVTCYAYFALGWALKHASPTLVLAYSSFQPIGTMILAFVFLGNNSWSGPNVVGGMMVVIGLVLTTRDKTGVVMRSSSGGSAHSQDEQASRRSSTGNSIGHFEACQTSDEVSYMQMLGPSVARRAYSEDDKNSL